ncbi:MAG: ATP-binding protein [Nitrospirota bacterium]|nr:ATP-binding protein [Nitrospirota bacterium]
MDRHRTNGKKGVFQLMNDRREFQLIQGFRPPRDKPTQPRESLAQERPHNTDAANLCQLGDQAEYSLLKALKTSEKRVSALLHDRSRIGQELHESVLHALYTIRVCLAQPAALYSGAPLTGPHTHHQAADQLSLLIQNIERMIRSLESDRVDPFRLIAELQGLAQTAEQAHAIQVRVKVEPAAEEILTGEEARELVAITREALNNSVRHARATRIVIALRHIGSCVRLRIRDNGSGFDMAQAPAKGLGFAQMDNQVRKVGGRLNIQSTVGRGTCITADVYLEPILTMI